LSEAGAQQVGLIRVGSKVEDILRVGNVVDVEFGAPGQLVRELLVDARQRTEVEAIGAPHGMRKPARQLSSRDVALGVEGELLRSALGAQRAQPLGNLVQRLSPRDSTELPVATSPDSPQRMQHSLRIIQEIQPGLALRA
jgi:hypothetical protein